MNTASEWYRVNADKLVQIYEGLAFEEVHGWLIPHLPKAPCAVLDIGCGTGRDAAAFARLGHTVTAVEPQDSLRIRAMELHSSDKILWMKDSLPKLKQVLKIGVQYDVILLSAVWMHVAPSYRKNAFRRIARNLLAPGGKIFISLRHGPHEDLQGFWDIPKGEVLQLANDNGLFQVAVSNADDHLGREHVKWSHIVLQSPGDGTGALPLLRGIVLYDSKSSTYKLGLLRVLLRIAQSAGGFAEYGGDDRVTLPLGLFALYWLRLYRPLLNSNFPQTPGNTRGTKGIGFASTAYNQLNQQRISSLDLRVGMNFGSEVSQALHVALRDICNTLVKMPMHYITYPGNSQQVFITTKRKSLRPESIQLNEAYLSSFGTVQLPLDIWQAAQKYGIWMEPTIINEWKLLIRRYAKNPNMNKITSDELDKALVWADPKRSTDESRKKALKLIQSGENLHCVWSGRNLSGKSMDIDHCFPFSVWPCDDLWNLLPTLRTVNQRQKRDKLPSLSRLLAAEDRILTWWDSAYVKGTSEQFRVQFFDEATASLPVAKGFEGGTEELFEFVMLQQMNLKLNQQVPEWM